MKNMKKVLVLALAALLLVAVSVAGTMAYLTAKTDPVTNTFKPSTLSVGITETVAKDIQIIPGVSVKKDPKVTYSTDVPAYLFVEVTEAIGPNLVFSKYVNYSVITGDGAWNVVKNEGVGSNKQKNVYYMEVGAGKNETGISVIQDANEVPDQVTFENVNLEDMDAIDNAACYPQLVFKAYIIQKEPFDSALAAWYELTSSSTGN